MKRGSRQVVYTRKTFRWVLAAGAFVMLVAAASGYAVPTSLALTALNTVAVLGCVWMTARSALCATILVRHDKVIFRTFLRSYRISRRDVQAFELFETLSGYGGNGVSICARLVNGKTVKAGEFWSKGSPGVDPLNTTCGRIVSDLNGWLNGTSAMSR